MARPTQARRQPVAGVVVAEGLVVEGVADRSGDGRELVRIVVADGVHAQAVGHLAQRAGRRVLVVEREEGAAGVGVEDVFDPAGLVVGVVRRHPARESLQVQAGELVPLVLDQRRAQGVFEELQAV